MPFKSKAQRGYLFEHNPKVAKEFAAATPTGAKLPEHVKKTPDTIHGAPRHPAATGKPYKPAK